MTNTINHKYEKQEYDYANKTVISKANEIKINEQDLLKNLDRHKEEFIVHWPIDLIEKLFKHHAHEINIRTYLNNFDFTIWQAVEENLAPLFKSLDPKTTTYGESMDAAEKIGHSEKHIQQTVVEFRKEVGNAMIKCGIDKEELKKMYGERKERIDNWWKYTERREYIYKKIRPIYIQLRKEGYTSFDLTY